MTDEHYPECHAKDIVPREDCYICAIKDGVKFVYNPNATCEECGAHIPMSGHSCSGLQVPASR